MKTGVSRGDFYLLTENAAARGNRKYTAVKESGLVNENETASAAAANPLGRKNTIQ